MLPNTSMPPGLVLGLSLYLLALTPLSPRAAQGEIADYALENGLRIYVIERHAVPLAAVQVWYRTGGLNERPGIRGLSHLFEHMMFRGSERFGPEEHFRKIGEVGGTNNAYTAPDVTVYTQVVPREAVEMVAEMEADRMARLVLDEEILETEVEVVKEEYRVNYENDPMSRLMLQLQREYFGEHPYSYGIGFMKDLDTVSVGTCRAYYRARYAPNNAALIVTGDVSPEKIRRIAERHFGPIAPSGEIAPDPPPPPDCPPRRIAGKEDLPVPITGVAYRLPAASDPDIPALEVLARVLGNRLERRLARESSLCVYATTETYFLRQASLVAFIGAHLPNVSQKKVRAAIEAEVSRFQAEPLSPDEFERARNRMILDATAGRAKVEGIAEGVGNAIFLAGDLARYSDRLNNLAALTPEALMETASRHLIERNRTEILIEPRNPSLFLKIAGWLMTTFHVGGAG
ncbi:MAG: insulinase family protein [Candidatus Latescibacterota bacterium]|nr:MAG: insulinase family protein [Candidatus Latescibacterota bacterium]